MKERFLVEDWTGKDPQKGEESGINIVDQDELWKLLQNAVEELPKIAVYKIGPCIKAFIPTNWETIDWS